MDADEILHILTVVLTFISELYIIHFIFKWALSRPSPDIIDFIFAFCASLCLLGVTGLLFTSIGKDYEPVFRAGSSLFCLTNIGVLVLVAREMKKYFPAG